ncbi:MAG TPA: DUF962 domain-containing protein [Gammaproteobacteria bacterium]|jgi:uncharacterized membrane protein YGL010W|nr:DUF962 domain-containing protein [Pseudomonadota bacterium]HAY45851.1 DUF962 domain-containing protein [Gammaproteobacteria bacterium]
MLGKPMSAWVRDYAAGHQHPINRLMHTWGIPMIVISIPLFGLSFIEPQILWLAVALFVIGWILQFVGHWFEGTAPEFFKDWRYLFVGLRWWIEKIKGKA